MKGAERRRRPPVGLMRLGIGTADYLDILRASAQELEALVRLSPVSADTTQLIALLDCIKAAVKVDDAPGTPAAILVLLSAAARSVRP